MIKFTAFGTLTVKEAESTPKSQKCNKYMLYFSSSYTHQVHQRPLYNNDYNENQKTEEIKHLNFKTNNIYVIIAYMKTNHLYLYQASIVSGYDDF